MFKYLLLFFLFGTPLAAQTYDGWSVEKKIDSVRVYSAAAVLIKMTNANNPGNCSDNSYLMLPDANSESGKRLFASLLAAYTSKATVNLALTGCSGGGTSGYAKIEQVWLK